MARRGWLVPLAAAALLVAGCGGSTTGSADTPTRGTSASPTSSPSGTTGLSPEEAVHRAALTRKDLPDGFGPDIQQEGDTVEGQVTLDLCGAHYPSDGLRIARHQVGFQLAGKGDELGIGNEVVAYRAGGPQQALSELRAAIRSCPHGYVRSTVASVPDLKYEIQVLPTGPGLQPGTLRVHVVFSDRAGDRRDSTATFQPRGRMLSILYFDRAAGSPALMQRLSVLLSRRLSAVDVGAEPNV